MLRDFTRNRRAALQSSNFIALSCGGADSDRNVLRLKLTNTKAHLNVFSVNLQFKDFLLRKTAISVIIKDIGRPSRRTVFCWFGMKLTSNLPKISGIVVHHATWAWVILFLIILNIRNHIPDQMWVENRHETLSKYQFESLLYATNVSCKKWLFVLITVW